MAVGEYNSKVAAKDKTSSVPQVKVYNWRTGKFTDDIREHPFVAQANGYVELGFENICNGCGKAIKRRKQFCSDCQRKRRRNQARNEKQRQRMSNEA